MLWQIFIPYSEFRFASNIVYFGLSMLWNISESFFNVIFFVNVTSSVTSSFFFSQQVSSLFPHSSLVDLPLLSSSGFIFRIYWTALVSKFLWLAIFFIIPLRLICTSLPLLSLFLSFTTLLSFLANFLFWWSIFVIHHMGLWLSNTLCCLLLRNTLCELINRYAGTNRRHALKKEMLLVTESKAFLLFK